MESRPTEEADPEISVVVPVYNERDSLAELHRQIVGALEAEGSSFEVLFIDDGSRDGSALVLDEIADGDGRVSVIHFRRNFGKSPALAAGFERARGEILLTMDADLQDDPAMIPAFLAKIRAGADLVSGYKQRRHDPLGKTLPSKLFNAVVRPLSGVNLRDFNCGFKAYRAECVREMSVYGGLHRFLPVLAGARGFQIEELVVNHRPRVHGKSKYGLGRFFDGFLDLLIVMLLTRYRMRPARFFALPGAALGFVGISILLYLTAIWFQGQPIGTRPLLTLGVLLTITSILLVAVGLLAELLVRTTLRTEEIYSVRQVYRRGAEKRVPAKAATRAPEPEPQESAAEEPVAPVVSA